MLKSRFSSNAPLVILIVVFLVLGTQTASAEGNRHIFMRFVGDFIQNIEQADIGPDMVPTGTTSTLGLVRGKGRGNLGPADLTAVTKAVGVIPDFDSRCPLDFVKIVEITDNNIVLTFWDLSALYGDAQGVVCLNFDTFEEIAVIEGNWEGGMGRFRDASGDFSLSIDESYLFQNTQVTVEKGTLSGTLRFGQ